jgi:hypothetical protein
VNFRAGHESGTGAQRTCDYAAGPAQVSITIQRLPAPLDLPAEMDALRQALPGSTALPIDAASFFLEIPGAGAQLHLVRGGRDYLMVSILGLGGVESVGPAARQLARGALARF